MLKTVLTTLLLSLVLVTSADPSAYIEHYTQRAFVAPIQYSKKDLRCLTQAIYYEAGNQKQLGKEAVATVVVNRVRSKLYPKTICGVVYQYTIKNDKKICQFSFACIKHNRPHPELWQESKIIALRVLQNYYHRDTLLKLDRALWFHADYVRPRWSYEKVMITKIGQHLFYRDRG